MCGDAGQLFGVQKSILILFLVSLGAKSVRYKQLVGTVCRQRGSTEIRWIIYYHPFLVFKFRRIIKPQISKTNILKNCLFLFRIGRFLGGHHVSRFRIFYTCFKCLVCRNAPSVRSREPQSLFVKEHIKRYLCLSWVGVDSDMVKLLMQQRTPVCQTFQRIS